MSMESPTPSISFCRRVKNCEENHSPYRYRGGVVRSTRPQTKQDISYRLHCESLNARPGPFGPSRRTKKTPTSDRPRTMVNSSEYGPRGTTFSVHLHDTGLQGRLGSEGR